jgi:hypothetical protein
LHLTGQLLSDKPVDRLLIVPRHALEGWHWNPKRTTALMLVTTTAWDLQLHPDTFSAVVNVASDVSDAGYVDLEVQGGRTDLVRDIVLRKNGKWGARFVPQYDFSNGGLRGGMIADVTVPGIYDQPSYDVLTLHGRIAPSSDVLHFLAERTPDGEARLFIRDVPPPSSDWLRDSPTWYSLVYGAVGWRERGGGRNFLIPPIREISAADDPITTSP